MTKKVFVNQTTRTSAGSVIRNMFSGNSQGHDFGERTVGNGIQKVVPMIPHPFRQLKTEGCIDVNFVIFHENAIQVIADENIIDLIKIEYSGDKLTVGFKDNISFETQGLLQVNIVNPFLDKVELSGSGEINVKGLDQDVFSAILSGSGNMDLAGTADSADVALHGSGNIDSMDLRACKLVANLHGSGNIEATATNAAHVKLYGSGNIKIYGNPPIQESNCNGSGKIKFR